MPLQIRRGDNAQREAIVFAEGEIVYTIDTKKLYVGDGSTTGGIAVDTSLNFPPQLGNNGKFLTTNGSTVSWATVAGGGGGITDVSQDTSPSLGGNLDLNSHNITGTGNINIGGTLATPSITIGETIVANSGLPIELHSVNDDTVLVHGITNGDRGGSTEIVIQSSRSSIEEPENTQINDYIGTVGFRGYYNGSYVPAALVTAKWEPFTNFEDAQPASHLQFTINTGTVQKTAGFSGLGIFYAPLIAPASYNGLGNYPTALPPGNLGGMIIFDSSSKKLSVWSGTSWNSLASLGQRTITFVTGVNLTTITDLTGYNLIYCINNPAYITAEIQTISLPTPTTLGQQLTINNISPQTVSLTWPDPRGGNSGTTLTPGTDTVVLLQAIERQSSETGGAPGNDWIVVSKYDW